jgi:leader peptidase (prepilin peptidase)/N-methyltransferase
LLILIPVAVIDLYHYIIPDSISLGGLAAACLVSFVPGGLSPQQAALGVLAGGGSLLAVGLIGEWILKKKDAMGGGDIKLMAFTGAAFGWQTALLGIVFGSLCGSIIGIGLIIAGKLGKERRIPFGPFLAIGIWTAALYGQRILDAYMRLIEKMLFS